MTIKRIGLIGVGLMGHGIGKNILAKGYPLKIMAHHNRAPVDSLIALGAQRRPLTSP
jgi:3-hydroxyisobutyrate dehydrogenase-like beta-hydroxyacid dehydrogenase